MLTPKGWEEVDAIEKPAALRDKAFVAMWFNDLVTPAFRDGIEPAITETGYRAIRIDLQEHSDSVIDRIIAEIKESRFVVADFTGQRGGVYFEAGFARGLGLNVIRTCKDDHLENLHFDVKGFNVIV
jgi:nucleoside 2-deoxyribosyltransferase